MILTANYNVVPFGTILKFDLMEIYFAFDNWCFKTVQFVQRVVIFGKPNRFEFPYSGNYQYWEPIFKLQTRLAKLERFNIKRYYLTARHALLYELFACTTVLYYCTIYLRVRITIIQQQHYDFKVRVAYNSHSL